MARLFSGPRDQHRPLLGGVSIGVNSTDAGTMGGIVTDHNGKYFGLTCAHVAQTGNSVDQPARTDNAGSTVGAAVLHSLPAPFPSHARKIEVDQRLYSSKVDAALVELSSGGASPKLEVFKMGKVTDLIAIVDIEQDEELELTGRSSDWQKVRRSSVSPFYNVKNRSTGDEYCFEDALIIREPTGGPAVRPGDSGSWICKEVGTDYHLAAMVVGGDKQLGIAIASYQLKEWWEGAGFKLSVC